LSAFLLLKEEKMLVKILQHFQNEDGWNEGDVVDIAADTTKLVEQGLVEILDDQTAPVSKVEPVTAAPVEELTVTESPLIDAIPEGAEPVVPEVLAPVEETATEVVEAVETLGVAVTPDN
jgi:hypothetical protein